MSTDTHLSLMTIPQAAARIGVNRFTLAHAARRGTLTASVAGGVWLVTEEALHAYERRSKGRPGRKPKGTATPPTERPTRRPAAAVPSPPGAPGDAEAVRKGKSPPPMLPATQADAEGPSGENRKTDGSSEGAAPKRLGKVMLPERQALEPYIVAWCAVSGRTREKVISQHESGWTECRKLAALGVRPEDLAPLAAFVRAHPDPRFGDPSLDITLYKVRRGVPHWRGEWPKDPCRPKRVFLLEGRLYHWTQHRNAKPTTAAAVAQWEEAGYRIEWIGDPEPAMRAAVAQPRRPADRRRPLSIGG